MSKGKVDCSGISYTGVPPMYIVSCKCFLPDSMEVVLFMIDSDVVSLSLYKESTADRLPHTLRRTIATHLRCAIQHT
jgi:hypothetical protein